MTNSNTIEMQENRRAAFIDLLRGKPMESAGTAAGGAFTEETAARLLEQLQCYGAARGLSQAKLAGRLGIAGSSLSSLLAGRYAGDTDGHLAKIEQFLDREIKRAEKPSITKFVPTSVARDIFAVLERNHTFGTMGAVIAASGVGKTRSFQEYALRNQNVLLITAAEWMRTHSELAHELAQILGVERSGYTMQARSKALVEKLSGGSRLIIIDQAHQLSERGHQFLQNLFDQCNPSDDERRLGIVFGCTWKFWADISAAKGTYLYEQLTSRMDAGTNKKIGRAPFTMADIDLLFSRENLRFEITDAGREYLLRLANSRGGLRSAVANVDHLQHALIRACAFGAKITAESLAEVQAKLMLRSAA